METSESQKPRFIGILDPLIICLVGGLSWYLFTVFSQISPVCCKIYKDNALVATYELKEDRDIDLVGDVGLMKVRIEKNKVRVLSSPCKHGICVHATPIANPFQQIICVPNHVTIQIEGAGKVGRIDGIAQ